MSILYALSIGFNTEYNDTLNYTYENSANFNPFPTNYLTLCHNMDLTSFPDLPSFEPMNVVHGEERLTIHVPLRIGIEYEIIEKVVD